MRIGAATLFRVYLKSTALEPAELQNAEQVMVSMARVRASTSPLAQEQSSKCLGPRHKCKRRAPGAVTSRATKLFTHIPRDRRLVTYQTKMFAWLSQVRLVPCCGFGLHFLLAEVTHTMSVHVFSKVFLYASIYLSISLSIYLSVCLSIYLSIYQPTHLSSCLCCGL